MYSASTDRNVVPAVMIGARQRLVDAVLTTCSSGSRRIGAHVLADAVEDDDRVVHRVAGDGQHRRHDVQRQVVAEEGQEGQRHEHVVERGDDGADGEAGRKRKPM